MARTPPLAGRFVPEQLAAFDDEGLTTFLAPGAGGVDAARLGTALIGPEHDDLAERIVRALPEPQASRMAAARAATPEPAAIAAARRHVVDRLFWPLLYWHQPDTYEELISGEHIDDGLLAAIDVAGRTVADLGAGAGRFTLTAARTAHRVLAVDAVPPLLERLARHVREAGLDNVEIHRGGFHQLPFPDASVDIAVACSSLGSRGPFGGEPAVAEACRVLRRGGEFWVIWPDDPCFFTERGFRFVQTPPPPAMSFPSLESAIRLCRDFYGERAAEWVERHGCADVPYAVLGMRPPADACVLRVGLGPEEDDTRAVHPRPRPGIDVTPSR